MPYGDQGLPTLGRASVDPSTKPNAVSGRAGAKNKPAGAEAGWRLQRGADRKGAWAGDSSSHSPRRSRRGH